MDAIDLLTGLAWKSALVAALGLSLLRLARARSAAERSMIAHGTLAALVALPLAGLLLPSWSPLPAIEITAPVAPLDTADAPLAAALPAASGPSLSTLALALYLLPLVLLISAMLVAIARLFTMRARASVLMETPWLVALARAQQRMGFKHGTALLVSADLRSPISWGVVRPTIVLDPAAAASEREAEAIIAHELAHVARLDWAKLLAARVACALFWFNPLVWLLARESHQLREEAADDAVLLADVDDAHYAALLVNAARHDNGALLLAAHGVAPSRNSLKRRITRILDRGIACGPAGFGWSSACAVGLVGIAAPLAAFSAARVIELQPAAPMAAQTQPTAAPRPARAPAASTPRTPVAADRPTSVDTIVAMRANGVTPDYVATLRREGMTLDADGVIAAKAVGVDPDYARGMSRAVGVADVGDLAGARAVGVDPEYAAAMRAALPDVDLEDLIGARAVGITPAYVAAIRREIPAADLDQITGMRALGMTDGYIRRMRDAGMDVSDGDDVIAAYAVAGPPGSRARHGRPRRPPRTSAPPAAD